MLPHPASAQSPHPDGRNVHHGCPHVPSCPQGILHKRATALHQASLTCVAISGTGCPAAVSSAFIPAADGLRKLVHRTLARAGLKQTWAVPAAICHVWLWTGHKSRVTPLFFLPIRLPWPCVPALLATAPAQPPSELLALWLEWVNICVNVFTLDLLFQNVRTREETEIEI